MKQKIFTALITLFAFLSANAQSDKIYLDFSKKGNDIAPSMYGVFFEEINHAGEGGIYPDMIQNRAFEEHVIPSGFTYRVENGAGRIYCPDAPHHEGGPNRNFNWPWNIEEKKYQSWTVTKSNSTATYEVLTPDVPLHENTPNAMKIGISTLNANGNVKLINSGFWGIAVKAGEKYSLRFYLRTNDYSGNIGAKIYDTGKSSVVASQTFTVTSNNQWTEYTAELTPNKTINNSQFCLEFTSTGTIYVDYVSLLPKETYKGHGLRKDICGILEDLNPAFIRWPGGCVAEGTTLENRIKWEETLGDPMKRRGEYMRWGYRSALGFGYHEFLQLCEDLGSDAMFVVNVGLACNFENGDYAPVEDYPLFLQNIREAIEYAIGDISTTWGAKRAAAGHPEPFPLKYIELGNEHWSDHYAGVHDWFYSRLKPEYPGITFICTFGIDGANKVEKTDMIDPHWYVEPSYFYDNVALFDNIERGNYDIYVGEYAANANVGAGNMDAALSEAAFIMGMERNADIVKLTSYAPLLTNINQPNWACNLIWFDNEQVMGRASYYVQKMFADNRPEYNLSTMLFSNRLHFAYEGRIGLGTWATAAEYRSVKVSSNDGARVFYQSDFTNKQDEWVAASGNWNVVSGIYRQTDMGTPCISMMDVWGFKDCTIEVQARKTSGNEGFWVVFGGDKNNDDNYYRLNIGGWGNTYIVLEKTVNGGASLVSEQIPLTPLQNNRWYNLKVVLKNGTSLECYIDDDLVFTHSFSSTVSALPGRLQAIGGYDRAKGETVLKVVNAESKPFEANILLNARNIQSAGEVTTLAADFLEYENSFAEPKLVYPAVSEYTGFSSDFNYTFKPNSFTVLRIKSDEAAEGTLTPEFNYSDEPVLLHPKGEKLSALLQFAKDNYLSFAVQATILKAEIDIAETLLNQPSASDDDFNAEYTVLKEKIDGYFKAQMRSANEKTVEIQNNTFASGSDGWVCSENPAVSDNVAEYFWKSFSLKQKIEGLENGYYLATVQAFYRNGTHDEAFAAHQNGTEALNVLFFAGTKTAEVASVYNHHFDFGWNGYCNTMGEADRAFSADKNNFLNYLIVKVDDGTLTIGLRKSVTAGLDWVCFDNFRLFNIPNSGSSIQTPRADAINADTNVYNLLGRVVGKAGDTSQLEPGVYVTEHRKIIVRKR